MAIVEYINVVFDSTKNFWNSLDIKKWAEQVGGSSAEAVEASIYFGLTFATGFLFKKYFKFVFVCIVVTLFAIKALEYSKFLVIDWRSIKTFFGLADVVDFNMIMNKCFDWIKDHLLLFVASVVGFLVGYKLG